MIISYLKFFIYFQKTNLKPQILNLQLNQQSSMIAETDLHPTEPTSHSHHYHWREWVLCQDYNLTTEELRQFYDYHRQCNILFEGNHQRWDLIKQLYSLYFEGPPQLSGKHWLKLGFQGMHPETDFRGGGVFSLKLIILFVKNNLQLVKVMQNDKGGFFFAITTINIYFFLKKYFHLADFLVAGRDEHQYCNRRALKNFCRIIISERNTFQKMNEIFLKHFYNDMWLQAQKKSPQTELLQFNSLFQQLKKKIRYTFEHNNIRDFHEFINTWRDVSS